MGFLAATATRTNAGILARQRSRFNEASENREALHERILAQREAARVRAVAEEVARFEKANAREKRISQWFALANAAYEQRRFDSRARGIITEVAEEHGVAVEDILGDGRTNRVVAARHHAAYEIKRQCPNMTLPQIGRALGGKDHTSALNAIRRWPEKAATLGIVCKPLESNT